MADAPKILYLCRITKIAVHDAVFAGISRYAALRGWSAESVDWTASHAMGVAAILEARRPVGCIVECSNGPPDIPPAAFGRTPAVFTNCLSAPRGRRISRVTVDNAAVADAAFRELSDGNPAGFVVVGPAAPSRADRIWADARAAAFRARCRRSGKRCRCVSDWGGSADSPRSTLRERLAALPPHTAVFAVNDATAAEVAAAAREAGLSIPHDLTLVGVDDDTALCEAELPPVSSIPLDFESEGFLAASMLAATIARRTGATTSRPLRPEHSSIGPLLVVRRKSTGGRGIHAKFVRSAIETIRREACEGLTAAALAKRFRCSRWLLEKRFREATGHSVLNEIHHVRFRQVEALLSSTDVAIESIAGMCGFGSEVELRHLFRKRAGMSMREWRKQRR